MPSITVVYQFRRTGGRRGRAGGHPSEKRW